MPRQIRRIAVANLRPGMYVVKLDRPWLSTPFDPQGFPISSPAQVRLLARYCKVVHVDASRAAGKMRKTISAARARTAAGEASRSNARRRPATYAR